jgi:hypothetical protein
MGYVLYLAGYNTDAKHISRRLGLLLNCCLQKNKHRLRYACFFHLLRLRYSEFLSRWRDEILLHDLPEPKDKLQLRICAIDNPPIALLNQGCSNRKPYPRRHIVVCVCERIVLLYTCIYI